VTHPTFDHVSLVRETIALYREHIEGGDLACCDAIVLLAPDEAVVRSQRGRDRKRRRNFERNLAIARLQRPYWDALRPLFGSRLVVVHDGLAVDAPRFTPLPEGARRQKALEAIERSARIANS
jgi:hypothetical protein